MSNLSLYRKYRPATFAEVVGQEHVTRTLMNAIGAGKVSHAYLFAGSRGTGKTSTAKLLAKALNCAEGPTANPCGKCESCATIGAGTSLDVIEMDAASNRGIDDIRDIRDKVAYSPVEGRSKVYILDEVHMLTKEASNAFLKVLEEPPAHVVFVLCTTEPHKVIPTIQSRCQRFEFRRPDVGMVLEVLERVAAAEEIETDGDSLAAIARSSAGAFRDAIGILDQLATFCGKKITLADVLSMLGAVESELLFEAVDIAAAEDARGAILLIDRLAAQGRDFGQFAAELTGHLRNVFLLQQLDDAPDGLISAPASETTRLKGQARLLTPAQVMRFIELLQKAQAAIKLGGDPRLQLELAFIAVTRPEADMSTKSIMYRLELLEKRGPVRAGASPVSGSDAAAAEEPLARDADAQSSPAARPAPASPAGDGPPLDEQASQPELTLDKISRAWGIILSQVKKKKIPLFSLLQEARPVGLKGKILTIGFPEGAEFHKSQVEKPSYRAIVAESLKEVTGADLRLRCVIKGKMSSNSKEPQGTPASDAVIAMIKDTLSAEEI
ncbi:MAG: DNA polymerase III subunit gamma/tau [Actinobacteria bacterium]|nr:DNA polymerase III subunit gamma/tau [Actinomycetota bacterium]